MRSDDFMRGIPYDEQAMQQHMRALALREDVTGLRALRGTTQCVRDLHRAARALQVGEDERSDELHWILSNARVLEALFGAQARPTRLRLPATQDGVRVQTMMDELVAHSDALVTPERLAQAICAYDEVRALRMDELWSAPCALSLALEETYCRVGQAVLEREEARRAAEAWAEDSQRMPARRDGAFCERALQLLHEREEPARREALEKLLPGESIEELVRVEREKCALSLLLMNNLLSTMRMLEGLDWAERFEQVSRVEQALLDDPSGTYPRMDKASRAQVRAQVVRLSRASGLKERTVAGQAVERAQAGEGVRREVSWWLYTNEGLEAMSRGLRLRKTLRLYPDPAGAKRIGAILTCCALEIALFGALKLPWWAVFAWAACAWAIAEELVNRAAARLVKPKPLLRLALKEAGKEYRTLVVMPALLSGEARAEALADELETLGVNQPDGHIDFLLLGDLPDAKEESLPGDEAILSAAKRVIARANGRAGREKYYFLCRAREYQPRDHKYMAHERKRGALSALLSYLRLGENAFLEPPRFDRAYPFVLTLDAGGQMLPEDMLRLIATMAHPINRARVEDGETRGYAVLAPRVQTALDGQVNEFTALFGGPGGVDTYASCASDAWQDGSGQGIYSGKGILDASAFSARLQGRLPDNRILSHDLIEGLFAGAGQVNDVTLYEGHPKSLCAWLKRLERWTRGDWQLLPFACGWRESERLKPIDRFKLCDNLLRSLLSGGQVALILAAFWLRRPEGILFALLPDLLPLIGPGMREGDSWLLALCRIAFAPLEAACTLRAIGRALWRQGVSKRRLLDWVTADDAEKKTGKLPMGFPRLCALAVFASLPLQPLLLLPGVPLCVLWWTADALSAYLERPREQAFAPDPSQRETLMDLAARTWRFFEDTVEDNGLPPDNEQLDPPIGLARRTSPTNAALYLMCCVSARELGLIDGDECIRRVETALETLESLEKWEGQLYNWYDTRTGKPLFPRYVSAVDSGNLAAALMCCAQAIPSLGGRLQALAAGMNLRALYDEKRELFYIGMDVESGRMSQSRYDLLASESRLLSYAAILLGQVPARHWRALGRAMTRTEKGAALLSWSGTMFEYLMPELLIPGCAGSLLRQSRDAVIEAQVRAAEGTPWGVSESGYYAFDRHMAYQYRAFGLSEVALRGDSLPGPVIAPYASLLCLRAAPEEVLENLEDMKERGWLGEHGLYEAADFAPERLAEGVKCGLVKSHMAHHQGMILCAIANLLADDCLVRAFMGSPKAAGMRLLLQEKPAVRLTLPRRREEEIEDEPTRRGVRVSRAGDPHSPLPDTCLLGGEHAGVCLGANGEGCLQREGFLANRPRISPFSRPEGFYVHLKSGNFACVLNAPGQGDMRARMDAGKISYTREAGGFEAALSVCLSPEDGALCRQVRLRNLTARTKSCEVTGCFEVALAQRADYLAHPAFMNLFVRASRPQENALRFDRRKRSPSERFPALIDCVCGAREEDEIAVECDLGRLIGRSGSLDKAPLPPLTGTLGDTLNPASAIQVRLTLGPGEERTLAFFTALTDRPEEFLRAHAGEDCARRALELAETQERALIRFLSLSAAQYNLFEKAAALLCFPRGNLSADRPPRGDVSPRTLWEIGISGEQPIVLVRVRSAEQVSLAREALRLHEFYQAHNLTCDLVLINEYGNDYEQPVSDRLRAMIAGSCLGGSLGQTGGAFLLEGQSLTGAQRDALETYAALKLSGEEGPLSVQLRRALAGFRAPHERPLLPVGEAEPGETLAAFNGWGGFTKDGDYLICRMDTPAPWCNVLAGQAMGALVTARGGGFSWCKNSRNGRLTAFTNDTLQEDFSECFLLDGRPLLPERTLFSPGKARFFGETDGFSWESEQCVHVRLPLKAHLLTLRNAGERTRTVRMTARIDWCLGVTGAAAGRTLTGTDGEILWARGDAGVLAAACLKGIDAAAKDGMLFGEVTLAPGGCAKACLLIACADTLEETDDLLSGMDGEALGAETAAFWEDHLSQMRLQTPDPLLCALVNRWLPAQALASRIWGRTGYYQSGGAIGFRDQLQDMLSQLYAQPQLVRSHLILCAAHQFEAGDVQHWWHAPQSGVRTHISDDLLFLPYVTAIYVRETGDEDVLDCLAPYLANEEIQPGREDWYGSARYGEAAGPLREHCMRALERAYRPGEHGLLLMGGGDWNDGMNRIGARGKGESVWLSEFYQVVARGFMPYCSEEERGTLEARCRALHDAIEKHAWDGGWYLRAIDDDGRPVGGSKCAQCRIDALSQSWAVLAGQDEVRARTAMQEVLRQLWEPGRGIVKLLTPPFTGEDVDPGYIRGYPPGVRENGGQYTHAACWVVLALARLGMAEEAWKIYRAILPCAHSDTKEKAEIYRLEPYAVAGDVYGEPPHEGRGGWSWYTGAAAWMLRVVYYELMGLKKRGDVVELHAQLPAGWQEASVVLRKGAAKYTLVACRGCEGVTLDGEPVDEVCLKDDGREHIARFPVGGPA